MFSALAKAFGQLSDPAFRRVLIRSVLAALAVFIVVWVAAWFGLSWLGEALSGWVAAQEPGGFWVEVVEWVFGAAGVVGVLIASFFLFPGVMLVALSLMLDDIAQAVERRHYPGLPPARPQPISEAIVTALVFAAVMLLLNLLVLPLYLLLLFVPPLNLFVFYLLNGYLLGREYFELVAARRFDAQGVRRLRRKYKGRVMLSGVVIAFLLTVPIVNLVTPIVATGFMLHVFERLRRRETDGEA
ncbi:MAG: EI24 domain-containing protein [Alphaproteobacteria bacterium]